MLSPHRCQRQHDLSPASSRRRPSSRSSSQPSSAASSAATGAAAGAASTAAGSAAAATRSTSASAEPATTGHHSRTLATTAGSRLLRFPSAPRRTLRGAQPACRPSFGSSASATAASTRAGRASTGPTSSCQSSARIRTARAIRSTVRSQSTFTLCQSHQHHSHQQRQPASHGPLLLNDRWPAPHGRRRRRSHHGAAARPQYEELEAVPNR
jgi:hypothetical protein